MFVVGTVHHIERNNYTTSNKYLKINYSTLNNKYQHIKVIVLYIIIDFFEIIIHK